MRATLCKHFAVWLAFALTSACKADRGTSHPDEASVAAVPRCPNAPPTPRETESPRPIVQGRHTAAITDVAFSVDRSPWLASASDDGSVRIWDPSQRLQLALVRDANAASPGSVAWDPSGLLVAGFGFEHAGFDLDGARRSVVASGVSRLWRVPGRAEVAWIGESYDRIAWFDRDAKQLGDRSIGGLAPSGAVAVSADGGTVAAIAHDRLRVWSRDAMNAAPRELAIEAKGWRVALSSHGRFAVVGALDFGTGRTPPPARLTLHDLSASGASSAQRLATTDKFLWDLVVTHDDTRVIAATDDALVGWTLDTREAAFEYPTGHWARGFRAVDVSADDRWLAAGTTDGAVLLYDLKLGRLDGEVGATVRFPRLVAFRGGDRLAIVSHDRISQWSLARAVIASRSDIPGTIAAAATTAGAIRVGAHPDPSKSRCSFGEAPVALLDVGEADDPKRTGDEVCIPGAAEILAIDAQARRVVVRDDTVVLRDLAGDRRVALWVDQPLTTSGFEFVAAGALLVAHGHLGPAYVWDAKSGKTILRAGVEGRSVGDGTECAHLATVSDDGRALAVGCAAEVALRTLPDGATAARRAMATRVTVMRFVPGSASLLLGLEDGTLARVEDGEQVFSQRAPGGAIVSIAVDPTGTRAATVGADGGVRVWRLDAPAIAATLVEFADDEHVAFTPAGAYTGTAEVAQRVGWAFDRPFEYFRFEQFSRAYDDADIVRRRLRGDDVDARAVSRRPPRVRLVGPPPVASSGGSAQIRVEASSDVRVDAIHVYAEGRPIAAQAVCKPAGAFATEVPLLPGINRVSAVAFDDQGLASNPISVDVEQRAGSSARPDLWVVAIGVSRYPHLARDLQLDLADDDAEAIAARLRKSVGAGKTYGALHETVLTDAEVTVVAVERALEGLAKMAPSDVAVVMLAGHGVKPDAKGDMVFLTGEVRSDADGLPDAASAQRQGVAWSRIGKLLARARGRVLLLLDACHSGHFTQDLLVQNQELAIELSDRGRAGVVVFAASKGRQFSYEGDVSRGLVFVGSSPTVSRATGGHGYFTGAILRALDDAATDRDLDGAIELSELVDEVTGQVTRATRGLQTPWIARREVFGDFRLAAAP